MDLRPIPRAAIGEDDEPLSPRHTVFRCMLPAMRVHRRDALRLCALTPLAALGRPAPPAGQPQAGGAPGRVRLAVSTYSYWHFKEPKYPVERVIADAARLGFDGVEILHRQMDGESP